MSKRLDENLGNVGYDGLIVANEPVADVLTVTIRKEATAAATYKRGTVLALSAGTAASVFNSVLQLVFAILLVVLGLIVAVNCLRELFTKESGSMPDEEPEWSEMGKAEFGRAAAAEAPADAEAAKA